MAVHLPLSQEAQAECRFLLLSPNNLLKPSDGGPVAVPSQDMVLGIYYLTMHRYADFTGDPEKEAQVVAEFGSLEEAKEAFMDYQNKKLEAVKGKTGDKAAKAVAAIKGTPLEKESFVKVCVDPERNRVVLCRIIDVLGRYFYSMSEAILAYENGEITLHQDIKVKQSITNPDGTVDEGVIESTLGRLFFNEILPQDIGFVDRSKPENRFQPEINFLVKKKNLETILEKVINTHGATRTAEVLDDIKAMGYKYSTKAAMTVSISDMTVPAKKAELLEEGQQLVDKINKNFRRGLSTEEERYKEVIGTWKNIDDRVTKVLLDGLDKYNNIYMMADSGARGSNKQIKQLAGMRGLMADTTGRTIELPVKSNFREGLDVLEYFISAHGARKGLSDTALRTADSGYLTRRLVDVSQELVINESDCAASGKEIPGTWVYEFANGKELVESLHDRILGRYTCYDIKDKDGNIIVKANHMITPRRAEKVINEGVDENGEPIRKVKIRTILTCRSHTGICSKCYGANMATGEAVQVGEAVGIIAAQSIGEPGTQLTMRTFHTGGVAGNDITQGLPRVEELFEARKPKGLAIISEFAGTVSLRDTKKKREAIVTNDETGESKSYLIPYGSRLCVEDGQQIGAGDELTEGSINPHDLLKIKGLGATRDYMLREVQKVYRLQGVEINDKHIELIVRQMLKKVRIESAGDSDYLPGTLVNVLEYEDKNEELEAQGKIAATAEQIMLGITKASLATDSFMSAASFQETTKVLTEAAIKGKIDPLSGLKENVIIGKLIPAGTGLRHYRNVKLNTDMNEGDFIDFDEEEVNEDEAAETED
jgi:DNA-directed RNA polymerase subunit beta'